MVPVPSARPTQKMAQHLSALRVYAMRVLVDEDALSMQEEQDKAVRLREFAEMAGSYRCTEKEIVSLIFKGCFK